MFKPLKDTGFLYYILSQFDPENRVCQEQERNELEQEGWHGAIAMLLSENHSADQSAFLDLCVSPSASILLFFLLVLLFLLTPTSIQTSFKIKSAVLILVLKIAFAYTSRFVQLSAKQMTWECKMHSKMHCALFSRFLSHNSWHG